MGNSRFDIYPTGDGFWRVIEKASGTTARYDGILLEHLPLMEADDLARLLNHMAARAARLEYRRESVGECPNPGAARFVGG